MTGRTWLLVTTASAPSLHDHDRSVELRPIPDELAVRDRMAIVTWPEIGIDRRPMLAGTVTVTKLLPEAHEVRLRHRVSPVPGHVITVASLGTRLAVARGWRIERRAELLEAPRLIAERDFELIENALLDTAHAFGPRSKRPTHTRPRTPGRRARWSGRIGWGR